MKQLILARRVACRRGRTAFDAEDYADACANILREVFVETLQQDIHFHGNFVQLPCDLRCLNVGKRQYPLHGIPARSM